MLGFAKAQTRADLYRAKFLVEQRAHRVPVSDPSCTGASGMTEEYTVGHYLRRVHVQTNSSGTASRILK